MCIWRPNRTSVVFFSGSLPYCHKMGSHWTRSAFLQPHITKPMLGLQAWETMPDSFSGCWRFGLRSIGLSSKHSSPHPPSQLLTDLLQKSTGLPAQTFQDPTSDHTTSQLQVLHRLPAGLRTKSSRLLSSPTAFL